MLRNQILSERVLKQVGLFEFRATHECADEAKAGTYPSAARQQRKRGA
jgi:hypothetical protein